MESAKGVAMGMMANRLFAFELGKALAQKGLLTREEVASVMVGTANQVRRMTEGDEIEKLGESFARQYEEVGSWILQWLPPSSDTTP